MSQPPLLPVVYAPSPSGMPSPHATSTRRDLLKAAVLGGLAVASAGAVAGTLRFAAVQTEPPTFTVPLAAVPQPGEAVRLFVTAHLFLVNLLPGEGGNARVIGSQTGGLLALDRRCPWRFGEHNHPLEWPSMWEKHKDYIHCGACASTFTKAGIRVYGLTALPMLAFPIETGAGVLHIGRVRPTPSQVTGIASVDHIRSVAPLPWPPGG